MRAVGAESESWSKAPDFADQPGIRQRIRAEAEQDRQAYLERGLQPVQCQRCDLRVRVKKHSPQHTSVQWPHGGTEDCAEFVERSREGHDSARLDGCPDLQASIEREYRDGTLRQEPN